MCMASSPETARPSDAAPFYAELAAATNYSFLHGASHPREMVREAVALGLSGIGIADRNTVAGVVRAHVAARELREAGLLPEGFRLVVGARLCFADGTGDILAYPATRLGWGRLTRLLTLGNRRAQKGSCTFTLPDLLDHGEDLLLIALPGVEAATLAALKQAAPGRVWLGAAMHRTGRDARLLARAQALAERAGVPLVALNDALYATPEHRPVQDVLTAIRLHRTVREAGRELLAHAERHLKPPAEMARLFAACPDALAETARILARMSIRR